MKMSDMTKDKEPELLYDEVCQDCGGRGDWDTGPNYQDYAVCDCCDGTGIDSWAVIKNQEIRERSKNECRY